MKNSFLLPTSMHLHTCKKNKQFTFSLFSLFPNKWHKIECFLNLLISFVHCFVWTCEKRTKNVNLFKLSLHALGQILQDWLVLFPILSNSWPTYFSSLWGSPWPQPNTRLSSELNERGLLIWIKGYISVGKSHNGG